MDTTPVSLLERMRVPGDELAWNRFVELATPLLNSWARRVGLKGPDAADLVQDVLIVLVRELPHFSYDREKSFRGWMRTIALNKWRERLRRPPMGSLNADIPQHDQPADDPSQEFWEHEFRGQLVARAMDVMRAEFSTEVWRACWEHVVSGRSAAEVGVELGMSAGAVYAAKSRVLKRLREELKGMIE